MAYITVVSGGSQPVFATDVLNGSIAQSANLANATVTNFQGPKLDFYALTANAALTGNIGGPATAANGFIANTLQAVQQTTTVAMYQVNPAANTVLNIAVQVPVAGRYLIDFRYANGSGPWNTDNKCAIRSLYVNTQYAGSFVFPQRGKDEWSEWGYSNARYVNLNAGTNNLQLKLEPWNINMNVDVNTAMLDALRLVKM